jgi:hypothetical protein
MDYQQIIKDLRKGQGMIRNQSADAIEKLLAENEKLKQELNWKKIDIQKEVKRYEELKQFKAEVIDAMDFDDDLEDGDIIDGITNMNQEYDPTKLDELKQFAVDVHNFAFGTQWDDLDIVSAMDFDCILLKMKKDEE